MMKFKQEGLKIVTYREPEPRRIEWEMAALSLVGFDNPAFSWYSIV